MRVVCDNLHGQVSASRHVGKIMELLKQMLLYVKDEICLKNITQTLYSLSEGRRKGKKYIFFRGGK